MITILDRYLARNIIGGSLLVAFLLVALSAFLLLIGQMSDFAGQYDLWKAIQYVLLSMPQQVYELFPMSVLLGSLLGLGGLASGNELMVMRAAGISTLRLGRACILGGVILGLGCFALGEFIAPQAEQHAKALKNSARMNRISYLASGGIWAREGNTVFNVQQMIAADHLLGLSIYRLDESGGLDLVLEAREAMGGKAGWTLKQVKETRFTEAGVASRNVASMPWPNLLETSFLRLLIVDPEVLSLRGLSDYMEFLERNGLDVKRYEQAFWTKVVIPFSVVAMVLLALPFVFGPLRSVGAGQRVIFGVLIGVIFYLVNLTLSHSGLVFGLPPLVSAWVPTVLAVLIATAFLRRVP